MSGTADGETTFTRTCPTCGRSFSYARRGVGNRIGRHPTYCSPKCRPGDNRRDRPSRAKAAGEADGRTEGKHPATSMDPLDPDEWEFVQAVDRYKKARKRPFPALSELLQVLKSLGYRKEPVP